MVFLIVFLSAGIISADRCCLDSEQGVFDNVPPGEEDTCNGVLKIVSCEQLNPIETDPYIQGCCVDIQNQMCTDYTPRIKCDEENLKINWYDEEICEVIDLNPNPCEHGCCIIEGRGEYTKRMECDIIQNNDKTFNAGMSFDECSLVHRTEDLGACLSDIGTCTYGTRGECSGKGGVFKQNQYCCDVITSGCISEAGEGCVEGENDVYYFDSNGQRERKSQDCIEGEETCGINDNGDYDCINLNCDDEGMKNGESLCLYSGNTGEGHDTPGSEHWIKTCIKGEVEINLCGPARTGICLQDSTIPGQSKAVCVANDIFGCLAINYENFEDLKEDGSNYDEIIENIKKDCGTNPFCMVKSMGDFSEENMPDYFTYNMCIPKSPRPADLDPESEEVSLCELATQTCTVYYQKNTWGARECVANCDCQSAETLANMNNLCISMGDCGFDVNINKNRGIVEGLSYSPQYEHLDERAEEAEALIARIWRGGALRNTWDYIITAPEDYLRMTNYEGEIREGVDGTFSFNDYHVYSFEYTSPDIFNGRIIKDCLIDLSFSSTACGFIAPQLFGIGIPGLSALWGAGDISTTEITYNCEEWQAPHPRILDFSQDGPIDMDRIIDDYVELCETCNEDDVFPCTKYKCESLGRACEIIPENSDNPVCVYKEGDREIPRINIKVPEEENFDIIKDDVSSTEYVEWNLNVEGFEDCLREESKIIINASVHEPAQCRYGFERYGTYEDIPISNTPVVGTDYVKEHSFKIELPSVNQFVDPLDETCDNEDLVCGNGILGCTEECDYGIHDNCAHDCRFEKAEHLNLTIRCIDNNGFVSNEQVIDYCLEHKEDKEAPVILGTSPQDGYEFQYNPEWFDLYIYTDEEAECRFDFSNKNYKFMNYTFELQLPLGDKLGWRHYYNMTSINVGLNRLFIKCNDTLGNLKETIPYVYEYNLKRDIPRDDYIEQYGLRISSMKMDYKGDYYINGSAFTSGDSIIIGTLEVGTSKGIEEDGTSICYYKLNEYNEAMFKDTNSNYHSQTFDNLVEGNHTILITCTDGLVDAQEEFHIEILVDDEAPEIISVNTEGGQITVQTNEEAVCSYVNNPEADCSFGVDSGIYFSEEWDYLINHTTEWNPNARYLIKCKDIFGNEDEDECTEIEGDGDYFGPEITRIYYENGALIFKTDLPAICYYDFEDCEFSEAENSENVMSSDYSREHYLSVSFITNYHIKCKDEWDFFNEDCAAIIQAGSF